MSERVCAIAECYNPHYGRGYCQKHYMRWYTHGDPTKTLGPPQGEIERYYQESVLPYNGDECLLWPYNRGSAGYGQIVVDGKKVLVSRRVCQEVNGPPPTHKHQAAHSCGNGHLGCATKRHLSWKSPKENQADRLVHGTHCRGDRSPRSKLTEAQVRQIRSAKGTESAACLGQMYGVSPHTIINIRRGESWAWLDLDVQNSGETA